MTRKRCNRKVWPLVDPIKMAMTGAQSVASHEKGSDLQLRNIEALDELRKGTADADHMGTLSNMVNMTRALATKKRKRLGARFAVQINEAQESVLAIGRRAAERGGRYIAKASELDAITLIMDMHSQQLDLAGIGTLDKARKHINRSIASGHAVTIQEAA